MMLAAGALDPSFSGDGIATVFNVTQLTAVDVGVQSTGKPVVAGQSAFGQIALARFNTDGVVDPTFGSGGTGVALASYTDLNPNFTFVSTTAMAIQPADDKIVVVGTWSDTLVITRFTADGQLDPTFSGDGRLVASAVGEFPLKVFGGEVAMQPDGRIVVAATVAEGFEFDFAVARYLSNGNVDTSFSGDGAVRFGFGADDFVHGLTIDPSGRIVVVGNSSAGNNDIQFAVARLTTGGSLDSGFSGDGRVLSRFTASTLYSSARDVVAQPDGKLVIVGEVGSADFDDHDTGLFRLNVNGTGDPSFGVGNGQTVIDFGAREIVSSMIVGQAGQLLVGGTLPVASTPADPRGLMTVACLSASGVPDTAFGGGDGKLEVAFGADFPLAAAHGMALAPNGTFVAAGGLRFATARIFDRKFATISIGTFGPQMFEQGQVGTSFFVTRNERLPIATRVFIGTGGQATPPNTFPIRPRDYFETVTNPPSAPVILFGNGQTSTTYVDIPANSTFVTVSLTPADDATVEGDELAIFTVGQNAAYDVALNGSTTLVIRDNDLAVPGVVTSAFLFETAPQRLTFRFSQDVGASLSGGDFQINGATGIPAHATAYDAVTNTATLSFPTPLPDGNFEARVVGAGVTNAGGTPMAADSVFAFFFLAGDANRDRAVDIADFAILAGRFNLPGTFSQGDFDYTGTVGIGDFAILASKFNTTLPAPAAVGGRAGASAERVPTARLPGKAARPLSLRRVAEVLDDPTDGSPFG